jgi:hypothetical protein
MEPEPERSSLYSQQTATGPYPESTESTPHHPPASLPKIHSDPILPGHLSGLFPSGFLTKTLYTFLSSTMHAMCLGKLILLDLICLMILGMSTNYEAPHCAISSIILLLHPSFVPIFSLEPCSQTPSVYALPLM